jgi:hypothetical protein
MSDKKNNQEEEFIFDKFMDDIVQREDVIREHVREYAENHEDHPGLRYNKLYRERPQNRIVYKRKK